MQTGLIHYQLIDSPVGPLAIAAHDSALCLLGFSDPARLARQVDSLSRTYGGAICQRGMNSLLEQLRDELAEYFAGSRQRFDVPLDYPGSQFQGAVWQALLEIPYGRTCSYKDIAVRVGDAQSSRAVGAANGSNRIAIVIPCHRVVNADGTLGGYGGGLERKRTLLDLERGQLPLL